jgi:hypothetical protein
MNQEWCSSIYGAACLTTWLIDERQVPQAGGRESYRSMGQAILTAFNLGL